MLKGKMKKIGINVGKGTLESLVYASDGIGHGLDAAKNLKYSCFPIFNEHYPKENIVYEKWGDRPKNCEAIPWGAYIISRNVTEKAMNTLVYIGLIGTSSVLGTYHGIRASFGKDVSSDMYKHAKKDAGERMVNLSRNFEVIPELSYNISRGATEGCLLPFKLWRDYKEFKKNEKGENDETL